MKSPAEQKIIQIDITNACPHACSNCTRFCGHHSSTFMMDEAPFRQAVDSLVKFPGMVGIMGGEPTIHPQFEPLVNYYADKIGGERHSRRALEPIVDFSEYRTENLASVYMKRGLWTSLGAGYYRHFELIQEVFGYQCINDHTNPGLHQALLVSRKELGIPDDEWIKLRDACWIQNLWSSCVTPKGAFFCEVAGALDMLFDGPGGWPVESGWWERTPSEFGDQLQWCELCGAALKVPRRQANNEIDDVSPQIADRLKALNSPKLRRGKVCVLDTSKYNASDFETKPNAEWYLPENDNAQRIAATNRSIFPQQITMLVYLQASDDLPYIKKNTAFCEKVYVVCNEQEQGAVREAGLECVVSDAPFESPAFLQQIKADCSIKGWVLILRSNIEFCEDFFKQVRDWVLNPGCLYYQAQAMTATLVRVRSNETVEGDMLFFLLNMNARALRDTEHKKTLKSCWPEHKRIDMGAWYRRLKGVDVRDVEGDMLAQHMLSLWASLTDCFDRVVLYGGGKHTEWLLELFAAGSLPLPEAILDDAATSDQEMNQVPVCVPEAIEAPDAVMLSLNNRGLSERLKARCAGCWGDDVPVIDPYRFFAPGNYRQNLLR